MVKIDGNRCDGCGECVMACPNQALWFDEGGRSVKVLFPLRCKGCYKCVRACKKGAISLPEGARRSSRRSYPLEDKDIL
jgi:ferredoxin